MADDRHGLQPVNGERQPPARTATMLGWGLERGKMECSPFSMTIIMLPVHPAAGRAAAATRQAVAPLPRQHETLPTRACNLLRAPAAACFEVGGWRGGTAASAAGFRSSGLTSTRRQRRQVGTGAGSLVSRAGRAQHNEEGMGVGCRGSLARVARAPTISRRTSGPQTTTRSFGYCLCKVGHFHRRDAASTLHFGYALRRRPAARAVPGYECM